jgi:threonine dehydrogenase-like Zn-dependent dehydrogenase
VLKTTVASDRLMNLAPVVIDEITVVGSRCGPFATALEALRSNRIEVESLIDAELPLERGVDAPNQSATSCALKVLLSINPG